MRTAIRRSAHATALLVGGLPTALLALACLFVAPLLLLTLPFAPEAIAPVRALAAWERERAGRELGHVIPAPYRAQHGGRWRRFHVVAGDPATWRDFGWLVEHALAGTFLGFTALGLWPGIVASAAIPLYWRLFPPGEFTAMAIEVRTWPQASTLPFAQAVFYAALLAWVIPLAARAQSRLAERLLGPTGRAQLAREVERLTETRAEALESHGAELRRIERDLHDGVQAQLVAVAVRLGLAERALDADPAKAAKLLVDARAGIEDSLGNLRGVIRGIYPPILADRGLDGAIRALAGGQRVPVAVRVPEDLPRPPASIEAAAYFVVAESLTNVAKHSTAERAEVVIDGDATELTVKVRDDGQGGAGETDGSGLSGIRRRVAALDGDVRIDSPVNGGTTIEVRLPCG